MELEKLKQINIDDISDDELREIISDVINSLDSEALFYIVDNWCEKKDTQPLLKELRETENSHEQKVFNEIYEKWRKEAYKVPDRISVIMSTLDDETFKNYCILVNKSLEKDS